ncbi:MAG TPA: DNA repair protein RadA [Actinomycetota bacterium]|nr:DNA repair protein RadA [Actinomycetota bacterium]
MATRQRRTDVHSCTACGFSSPRWFGRCPDCGEWNSAAEVSHVGGSSAVGVTTLADTSCDVERFSTGLAEVDRVVGGGLVLGGVSLLAGEPGIGKSTLVLQLIDGLLRSDRRALLITGEESIGQVALRATRLGVARERFRAAATASLADVLALAAAEQPDVLVVDSVQTLENSELDQSPGSVVQVRECAAALVRHAKASGTCVILVGHVTKEGTVAGPKTLEHIVDSVLALEGERTGTVRLLRATKNRFGSCDETGVFTMGEGGLEAVGDPSAMLLSDRRTGVSGSVVFCGLEGTRPMLVEIQSLVADGSPPNVRRVPIGVDAKRLALLVGVLHSRAGLNLSAKDLFVAAAGGFVIREPAADLPLCLALDSAARGHAVGEDVVAIGEVGLGGEVRRVPGLPRRLAEAARLGFRRALVPRGTKSAVPGLEIIEVADVHHALREAARTSPTPTVRRQETHVEEAS